MTRFYYQCVLIALISPAMSGCKESAPETASKEAAPEVVVKVRIAPARVGELSETLSASGVVQPVSDRSANVNPGIAGKILAIVVKPGDRVRRGQVIAQLDPTRLNAQLRQANAVVAAARAQEAQASLELLSQEASYRSNVRQAEGQLRSTQLTLSKLRSGARPQEIGQARAVLAQAEANEANARAARNRIEYLFNRGIAAKRELLDAETTLKVNNAQVSSARAALSLVEAGPRTQEIADAEVQVAQARNGLRHSQEGSVDAGAKREALHAVREQVRNAQAAADAARHDLRLTRVTAPISGVVTQRSVEPGASVDLSTVLVNIADLSVVDFVAQLQPGAVRRVRIGQTAEVRFAPFPRRVWSGRIRDIGTVTDPRSNTLPARIRLSNGDGVLKSQMLGTTRIRLRTERGVLVPRSAVLSDEEGHYVFVVGPKETAQRKSVTIGTSTDRFDEIRSGLRPGEQVIAIGNYGLNQGTRVTVGP